MAQKVISHILMIAVLFIFIFLLVIVATKDNLFLTVNWFDRFFFLLKVLVVKFLTLTDALSILVQ